MNFSKNIFMKCTIFLCNSNRFYVWLGYSFKSYTVSLNLSNQILDALNPNIPNPIEICLALSLKSNK